ncbi:hypothetical protein EVAR_42774_1 [Eumeta japonica]|uniref:Uncharacterized protein n=1 Tax=Eumeta variegata TaxID=151549 RepID=A0A4C1WK10_EUMVA|nr:hypothetical protein EVAR_42774_1 [Eumeta japonica]
MAICPGSSKFFTSLFGRSREQFSESTLFKCEEKDKSCGRKEKKSIPFNWPVSQVNWVRGTKRVKGYVTCNDSTDIERAQ